jgi:glycosyltransferase involved in cell wall biosynthesis
LKPLSILEICLSSSWGGIEMYAVLVPGWWRDRGHRVTVVALRNSPIAAECRNIGIEVIEAARRGYLQPSAVAAVVRAVKASHPDVIHVHLSRDLWPVAISQIFVGKVPVVFSQQMASDYPKRDPLHRWVWSKVDRVVVPTKQIEAKTLRNTWIKENRIQVLPHGIDTDKLKPSATLRHKVRACHGIGSDQYAIGVVGRLDPGKGQSVFLEALVRLKQHSTIIGLLIGEETRGEPGYQKILEDQVVALALQERVRFLGYFRDPNDYYPMLDLLVLPSRKETFGMVVIEAMSYGLPVVATNAGGVPEIVVDGVTGMLVPPGDPEALVSAISELMSHREKSIAMGLAGRQRAIEKYQISTHIDQLELALYQAAGV